VIQELFGYLLWKEYNIERAIMLIGTGRNGKSKLMELMKRFIGPENCSSVKLQDMEGDNFNTIELHKKHANLCGDIDDRALKFTGSFKELTGRDLVKANRKFKTSLHFENYAKMVFSANQLPKTRDITEAFFMRWIILEFPYTFYNDEEYETNKKNHYAKLRDPDIINKIVTPEEMSGLFNWSLQGLERLQKQKDFSFNKSTNQVKKMWIRKSDSFKAFCMDHLRESYGGSIKTSELHHEYIAYCKENELKPVGEKSMTHSLITEYGASRRQIMIEGDRFYIWEGVKFIDGSEVEDVDQQKLNDLNDPKIP
jgi:putative DNA primase/helicase